MKKRKFSILLNVAVLCLCVAAIAFGVYSAKNASLNVTGTIGFQAHNCQVKVEGYITYAMRSVNDEWQEVKNSTGGSGSTAWSDTFSTGDAYLSSSTVQTWNFGDIYFDDMASYQEAPTAIMITIKISNYSKFPVGATLSGNATATGFTVKTINLATQLGEKSDTDTPTGTICIVVHRPTNNVNSVKLTMPTITIQKTTLQNIVISDTKPDSGWWASSESGVNVLKQVPALATENTTKTLTVPSYFKDSSGNTVKVTKLGSNNSAGPQALTNFESYQYIYICDGYTGTTEGNYVFRNQAGQDQYGGPATYKDIALPGTFEKVKLMNGNVFATKSCENLYVMEGCKTFSDSYYSIDVKTNIILPSTIENVVDGMGSGASHPFFIPELVFTTNLKSVSNKAFCFYLEDPTRIIYKGTMQQWTALNFKPEMNANYIYIYCNDGLLTINPSI